MFIPNNTENLVYKISGLTGISPKNVLRLAICDLAEKVRDRTNYISELTGKMKSAIRN